MSRENFKAEGVYEMSKVTPLERPIPFLVVGDLLRWQSLGLGIPSIPGFVFVDFEDVTAEKISEVAPQVILSPLLGRNFDAIEIARRLSEMGYAGRYSVVIKDIPDPSVIDREVRQVAPNLDFSVLKLPLTEKKT